MSAFVENQMEREKPNGVRIASFKKRAVSVVVLVRSV